MSWNSSDQAWWPGGEAFKIKPSIPVPMEIQRSFVLWMAVAGLMLLNFVLNMMQSVAGGGGSVGAAFFNLLLAAAIGYGAAQMRLGKAWGRLLNSIIGGLLGLLLLISLLGILTLLAILSSLLGAGAVLLALITLLTVGTALGLIVAALVYMFRAPASSYLSRHP